jgi:hypothetical protein
MTEPLDEFDRSLRDRIGAAEARVQVPTPAPAGGAAAPGPSRWVRPALFLATAAVAVVLAVVVIGQLPDRSVGDATPSPSAVGSSLAPGPISASARDGDFVLTLSSPRSVWTTEDAIEITAVLSYDGDEAEVAIGGACGPIAFDLVQVAGGSAAMGYAQCEPYISYPLGPDTPLVRPFQKSGELRAEPPFDRAFFEDPELHLPPGRWRATAILDFGYPQGSGFRTLEVSVEFDVVEVMGSPGPSAVATAPPVSSSPPESSRTPAPTFDDDPPVLTGIFEGDPDLEGGCAWLRDDAGRRWEIIWPAGYRDMFRDGVAVLVENGEAFAEAGDTITVRGHRPSGLASFCMVGILYQADSVRIP